MKFSLSSSQLADRLQAIGKVINTKNQMSILDCFLFEIAGETLKITASDSENTLVTSVGISETDGDFRFAINARTVLDAMRGIPEQPVTFNVSADNFATRVDYQNGHFSLVSQDADEYPGQTSIAHEGGSTIKIASKTLLDALTRALAAAAASDATHPVMTGVLFDVKEGELTIVASDGRKLEYTRMPQNVAADQQGQYVVAGKPAALLRSLLARESGDVELCFAESKVEVRMGSFSMTSRLVDGRFPPYDKVVPTNNPNHLVVNRAALQALLRRVLVFADQTSALVKMRLDPDQMTTNVQNIDYSLSAEENMLCEYDGMPMTIGFKGTTLSDFLGNLDCEEVEFQIADQSRAVTIVPRPQPCDAKDEEGNPLGSEKIVMLLMPSLIND